MSLPLAPGIWNADPTHSAVSFSVRHLGMAKVRGRFTDLEAKLDVADTLGATSVTATIDMASVDTGNGDRDAHLQSDQFFNAETHPTMTFGSSTITGDNGHYKLVGDLTINGNTASVELDVEFFGTETFPMDQSTRAGFSATGAISRKVYGIDFDVPLGADKLMIGDKVNLELDIQLTAPTS